MQVIDAPELEQVVRDNDVLYLLLHDASDSHIVASISRRLLRSSEPDNP